ncbi:MAG: cyclic nucleotide-binding domain-containing protein [Deltaproteobacteria bacterium]|nr:cyclic nucleotide-binding domain-containing protein [Deltaproteobacteria bacterium]MBW2017031.1 cyclic nucleotide-binding domain-containing protein [Deltaproteobacteria bacterium]
MISVETAVPLSAGWGLANRNDIIENLLPYAAEAWYGKDDEITVGGEQSHSLYYVQEGSVEVSHTLGDTKIVVALIGAGDFFGEIGFFEGASRVRDIRAIEPSLIRIFDQGTLLKIQRNDPILYGDFLGLLAQNICGKFRRILAEREPLTAYAASLTSGGKNFQQSTPIPHSFFQSPEWPFVNRVVEKFKARFYDLSYRLQEDSGGRIPTPLRDECFGVLDRFNEQIQAAMDRWDGPRISEYGWGYIFKEIFPYFMRSRFAERAYFKPRGYAGDFEMMERIYRNKPEGDGKLGVLVDDWCLQSAAARAVRGRRKLLCTLLSDLCHGSATLGRPVKVMNLACGSNRELFDFLRHHHEDSEYIEATCIDADPQALEYTSRHVDAFPHKASIRLMNDNVIRWSLGRVRHDYGPQDIIYCAGLADYLEPRLFVALITRCYHQLRPGGTLIIGNFGPRNPNRAFMDHILHWRLLYRSEKELRELFAQSPFGAGIELLKEEQGLNLFAVARKEKI